MFGTYNYRENVDNSTFNITSQIPSVYVNLTVKKGFVSFMALYY